MILANLEAIWGMSGLYDCVEFEDYLGNVG